MNSTEFNAQVVKKLISDCKKALAKMEYDDYEIAPEADRIITACIEQLEELV